MVGIGILEQDIREILTTLIKYLLRCGVLKMFTSLKIYISQGGGAEKQLRGSPRQSFYARGS